MLLRSVSVFFFFSKQEANMFLFITGHFMSHKVPLLVVGHWGGEQRWNPDAAFEEDGSI